MTRAVKAANTLLIGGIVICSAVSMYYFYNQAHPKNLTGLEGRSFYGFLPAALGVLLLLSLRLRPPLKVNLALVLASTAGSIYAAQLILPSTTPAISWFNSKPMSEKKEIAKKFGVDFDIRSRYQIVADLRREGVDVVPAVAPEHLLEQNEQGRVNSVITIGGVEVLPLAGVSNKVTVLCNELGQYTIFNSDEHGFANPKAIWSSSPIDIAAIGDSFTQGFCVPHDKNYVALLRKRYPATLNLGAGGNGPLLMLATLEEYLPYTRPKKVLWFYFEGNDLADLQREERSPLLMHYLTGRFQQGLLRQQAAIDRALLVYIEKAAAKTGKREKDRREQERFKTTELGWLESTVKLRGLRNALATVYGGVNRPVAPQITQADIDLFRDILLQAKTLTEHWGGQIYFVYLPAWERYGDVRLAEEHRDTVLRMVKTSHLPLIDIHPVFRAHPDPLALFPFREPAHYNVAGNQLVAGAVLRSIHG